MNKNKIKLAAIIAGIILLLVLGYFFLKPNKESYFETVDIPPTSVVINYTNDRYMDTIVHVGLNILTIDTVFIQIRKLKSIGLSGDDTVDLVASIVQGDDNQYIIFIKENESRMQNIEKVAHELIHLRDYDNNTLILFDKNGIIYGDGEWEDMNIIPYDKRPWEIAAFKEGPILAEKIKEKLYPKN
jgi:hypothetical protein